MRILFIDHSTRLKSISDLETQARGGMVSSLFKVTDHLAGAGHQVEVWSDLEENWQHRASGAWWIGEPSDYYDVIVFNRGIGQGQTGIEAGARVLWTHDLPHSGFIPEPKNAAALDCTVFMSRFAEKIWRRYYRDIGRGVQIPNGVDKALFRPREKNLGLAVYASAPNRGLRRLPLISDAIASRCGRPFETIAYSSWSMHPGEETSTDRAKEDGFDLPYALEDCETFTCTNPVPQAQLAQALGVAGLLLIPSDYPEICSNTVLQALSSGTPVITTGPALDNSVPEWVRHKHNGMLTTWLPVHYLVYQLDFVRMAVEVLRNEKRHRTMCENASKTMIATWDAVGERWRRLLMRLRPKRKRASIWAVGLPSVKAG